MLLSKNKRVEMRFKMKRFTAAILQLALLLAMLFALSGCSEGKNVVLTTGMKKDEVFRISDLSCRLPEVMVYLTNLQNQYESIYGDGIWEAAGTDSSMEDQAKEQILAELAQVKAMVLLAESKEVALTKQEEDRVQAAAKEYYGSLSETEIVALNVSEELLTGMYEEYALSQKVYRQIIDSVNPEISDDEARTVTILAIRTEEETAAQKALEQVSAEGADFETLAETLSEDTTISYSFGKGEADPAIEQAAFELGKNEISRVVSASDGYYVLKCISTFDEAQTKANKEKIADKRRNEAFSGEYNTFIDTLPRQLNEELWATVGLVHDEAVTTESFFAVYDKYFTVE